MSRLKRRDAFHLSFCIEMLIYLSSVLIHSLLFLFSHCRVLHMLSRTGLVFCSVNRRHLLLSPTGACPLSLLPGTIFTPQATLRGS